MNEHAHCPACGSPAVAVTRGKYARHRRTLPHSWRGATEACPNGGKPVPDDAIARWVAWEKEGATTAEEYAAQELADARATLERAEQSAAKARARLDAINAIAAKRAAAKENDR